MTLDEIFQVYRTDVTHIQTTEHHIFTLAPLSFIAKEEQPEAIMTITQIVVAFTVLAISMYIWKRYPFTQFPNGYKETHTLRFY